MRKIFFILASIFLFFAVVFTLFPMGQIGFYPIGLGIIFGFLALKKSEPTEVKWPKIILGALALCAIIVIGKEVFTKDEVAKDQVFEEKKIESKKEAQKELEELEGLE